MRRGYPASGAPGPVNPGGCRGTGFAPLSTAMKRGRGIAIAATLGLALLPVPALANPGALREAISLQHLACVARTRGIPELGTAIEQAGAWSGTTPGLKEALDLSTPGAGAAFDTGLRGDPQWEAWSNDVVARMTGQQKEGAVLLFDARSPEVDGFFKLRDHIDTDPIARHTVAVAQALNASVSPTEGPLLLTQGVLAWSSFINPDLNGVWPTELYAHVDSHGGDDMDAFLVYARVVTTLSSEGALATLYDPTGTLTGGKALVKDLSLAQAGQSVFLTGPGRVDFVNSLPKDWELQGTAHSRPPYLAPRGTIVYEVHPLDASRYGMHLDPAPGD